MTRILLVIILLGSGIIFMGSVLLMSPKGGLGLGIGGMSQSNNEYGSKKSIESKLKQVALVCACIFFVAAVVLPYTSHE